MRREFAATEDAFANGLSSIDPAEGLKLAKGWHEILSDADFDGADDIAARLGELVEALESGSDADLSGHISALGEATIASADEADGEDADKVRALGEAMCAA